MNSSIAAKIRNYIIVVTVVSYLLFTGLVLWWGSGVTRQATRNHLSQMPRMVALAQVNAFLELNYSALKSSASNLVTAMEDLGIAYVGMLDDRGRMFLKESSSSLPPSVRSIIENERLAGKEGSLLISSEEWVKVVGEEKRYRFFEIQVPVKIRGETPGAIKIGFVPDAFNTGWPAFRQRIFILSISLVIIISVLAIFIAQQWRDQIDNAKKVARNEVENEYKDKINQLERKAQSQPLSSDEFFQIIDFGKRINKSLEPVEVLRYLVNSVVKILSVKQVVVFLVSPDNPDVLQGQMGMKEGDWMKRERLQNIKIEIGSGEVGTIAELGQANILDKPRPGAGVAAALRAEGQTIGVIRATDKRTGARMGNKDKLKMRLISQLAGKVIKHSFDFQELKKS